MSAPAKGRRHVKRRLKREALGRLANRYIKRCPVLSGGAILGQRSARLWYWLLVIPFVLLLSPVYLRLTPTLAGFPFFYWYQLVLLFVSAGLTGIVYYKVRDVEP